GPSPGPGLYPEATGDHRRGGSHRGSPRLPGVTFFEFVGTYWWLVFPIGAVFGGSVNGCVKGVRKWDERRRRDRLELARIKYGAQAAAAQEAAAAQAEIDRTLVRHDAVTKPWLAYELDVAKLIDYPLITDMPEPLTVDIHPPKREAEALRPDDPADLADPAYFASYRAALRPSEPAFTVGEYDAGVRRYAAS